MRDMVQKGAIELQYYNITIDSSERVKISEKGILVIVFIVIFILVFIFLINCIFIFFSEIILCFDYIIIIMLSYIYIYIYCFYKIHYNIYNDIVIKN